MNLKKITQSHRATEQKLGLVFGFANFPIVFMSGLLDDPEPALKRIFYSGLLAFVRTKSREAREKRDAAAQKDKKKRGKNEFNPYDLCHEGNCYYVAIESLTYIEPAWNDDLEPSCLMYDKACDFVDSNYQEYAKLAPSDWRYPISFVTRYQGSLPTSKLKEFYEPKYQQSPINPSKKEFDYACLAAYIAIRSIVCMDSYKKITNLFILSRMDGRAKCVESVEELSPKIQKYAKEYWMKRIKAELYDSWGVKYYGTNTRGCYYSLQMPLERLVEEVEKKKDSTRYRIQRKKYQEEIAEIKGKLLGKKRSAEIGKQGATD